MANNIHPTAVIIGDVRLGQDNYIGPFALLHGPLRIGDRNYIGGHCAIGTPAEDLKHVDLQQIMLAQEHGVSIGNENIIREMITIHGGVAQDTTISNKCWILSQSHVDHDCIIHDGVMLAQGVRLSGNVEIDIEAQLGSGVAVHQNRRIGAFSMIGMNAAVIKNIPPCSLCIGVPGVIKGVNHRKMERMGIDIQLINKLNQFLIGQAPLPQELPEQILKEFKKFYSQPVS